MKPSLYFVHQCTVAWTSDERTDGRGMNQQWQGHQQAPAEGASSGQEAESKDVAERGLMGALKDLLDKLRGKPKGDTDSIVPDSRIAL